MFKWLRPKATETEYRVRFHLRSGQSFTTYCEDCDIDQTPDGAISGFRIKGYKSKGSFPLAVVCSEIIAIEAERV